MNSFLLNQYPFKTRAIIVLCVVALVAVAVTLFLTQRQEHEVEHSVAGASSVECKAEVSAECSNEPEPLKSTITPEPGPIHTTKLDSFEL